MVIADVLHKQKGWSFILGVIINTSILLIHTKFLYKLTEIEKIAREASWFCALHLVLLEL
jgi:hypothetical protein